MEAVNSETYLKRRLTDPPRDIPFLLAVQLLFGGPIGFLGWFFLGFGMIFVWIFAMKSDPAAVWAFRGELASAPGTVIATDDTHYSEGGSEHGGGTPVYAHRYRFTFQGRQYEGVSYRLGAQAEANTTVTVEFPQGRPERSRIRGMRSAPCGAFVLFVVLFPVVGLLFVLGKLHYGWRNLYLLKYGQLAQGKLVCKEPTNTSINDQTVYKLTFEFDTNRGTVARVVVKTHVPQYLLDDELETLVYDPTRPTCGTTLDQLPGAPRVAENGDIAIRSAGAGYLALALPAMTIIGHGAYVLMRYVL
jgi:hypothetical protein